jgi:hypothetical protein
MDGFINGFYGFYRFYGFYGSMDSMNSMDSVNSMVSMDLWIYGSMDLWIYGSTDTMDSIWILYGFYGYMYLRMDGSTEG